MRRILVAKAGRLSLAALCVVATAGSAIVVKEMRHAITQPMVAVELAEPAPRAAAEGVVLASDQRPVELVDVEDDDAPAAQDEMDAATAKFAQDPSIRWFNGRPVRPARTINMTVTAYSPDHRSCGDSADGITATLHPVTTNGHALVAADPSVLPYGSMITVPGYDKDRIVPVLDCGGAIKGRRLDVLYPTHEQARQWGVQRLKVTVWEYADGKPAENPRKVR